MRVSSATWVPLVFVISAALAQAAIIDEAKAVQYITELDRMTAEWWNKVWIAAWNYDTNLTDSNQVILDAVHAETVANEQKYLNQTLQYDWKNFKNQTLRRMFQLYSSGGASSLAAEKAQLLNKVINDMQTRYSTTKICDFFNKTKCDLVLENDIVDLFATSTNADQLKDAFIQWSKLAGSRMKQNYSLYVQLKNEAAKLNNFSSVAEWWISAYGSLDFEKQLLPLWTKVEPLYKQLHAYIRGKLRQRYGESVVSRKGPIPGHLLGDIWGLTWVFLEPLARPYPKAPSIDIAKTLVEQKYTPLKMFRQCDDFMASMNMSRMSDDFWKNSIFEKHKNGRDIDCNAGGWDMADGNDFRIKMCTELNYDNYVTMYHAMGHIQYDMQYAHQPHIFRNNPTPAFQASVGGSLSLSAITPKHFDAIGLYNISNFNSQTEINFLLNAALDDLAVLPFTYLLDFYRYNIFRGLTTPDNYNCHYWHLKERLQGFEPPAPRTEEDFDGAAKYHMVADSEFLQYYIGRFLKFQFHKAMCSLAGQYEPNNEKKKLSDCDVYKSAAAGNAFKKMLALGASKPWPEALEQLTGTRSISADGILEYYEPLMKWLQAENKRTGEYVGWEPSTVPYCTSSQKKAGFPEINV